MSPKASKPSHHPDTKLIAMVTRHHELWSEWDRINKVDEDDPRIPALSDEAYDLELRIVATPAHTNAGLKAKRRIIDKVGLVGDEAGNPPTGDITELIDAILAEDAERIAAAG
jgi:hypothetical protein